MTNKKSNIPIFLLVVSAVVSLLSCANPTSPDLGSTGKIRSTIVFGNGTQIAKMVCGGAFTNSVTGVGDGVCTFSSSAPAVATVDESTGEVTMVAPGTAVITASKAETDTHEAASAGYSLSVLEPRLPLLVITTEGNLPVINKEDWIKGTIRINDAGTVTDVGAMEIKGRGNTTWRLFDKKPYNIKLGKKSSMLGMKSHKRWVLLANYSDKTLLRNAFAFDLGLNVYNRFAWTPDSRIVEVVLNNDYIGVYQLVEQIREDENRVDIDVDSGEFLVEVNRRMDEKFNFTTKNKVSFSFKEPEEPDASQFAAIKAKLQEIEDVIYSSKFSDEVNGYAKYIDVDSFIDWYIINELAKNNDASFYSSVYMYLKGNKLYMGPLWDFDISFGNIDYHGCDRPEGYWVKKSRWISRLFKDPSFARKVKDRWNERKGALRDKIAGLAVQGSALSSGAHNNFARWDILNTDVWPNRVVTGSYDQEVAVLTGWLNARYSWLDNELNE